MNVEGWRAYYTGGREFDSAGCEWADLPADGVLALVLYYDVWSGDGEVQHRLVLDGSDWYFHDGDELFGSNSDPPDETLERYPGVEMKRGKWTTAAEMQAVKQRAMNSECP